MTSKEEFREEEERGAHFQHPPPIRPLSWAFPQGFFPVERGENQIKPTTLIIAGKEGDEMGNCPNSLGQLKKRGIFIFGGGRYGRWHFWNGKSKHFSFLGKTEE